MAIQFQVDTDIARPPDAVFEKLSDCRNEAIWNSQISKVDLLGPEPIAVGTSFRSINRGKPYTATISKRDKPESVAFDIVGKPMNILATYRLHPSGEGVRLHGELEMSPKGMMRAILPLIRRSVQKDLDRQYESFRRFCEAETSTAETAR